MDKLKLLELVSDYSKVAGYMANNWQKLTTFLYSSSEKQVEFEIRKQLSSTLVPRPMQYLEYVFFKTHVYHLYEVNYQTLSSFLIYFFK